MNKNIKESLQNYKLPNSYPKETNLNFVNENTVIKKVENNINSKLSILKSKKEEAKLKKVTWTVQVTRGLDKKISLFMIDNALTRTEAIEFLLDNALSQLNETNNIK